MECFNSNPQCFTFLFSGDYSEFSKNHLLHQIQKKLRSSATCVVLGLKTSDYHFWRKNIPSILWESDFEKKGFLEDINEAAVQTAYQWPTPSDIKPLLVYENISLGECLHHPIAYLTLKYLRQISCLKAISSFYHSNLFFYCHEDGTLEFLQDQDPQQIFTRWNSNFPAKSALTEAKIPNKIPIYEKAAAKLTRFQIPRTHLKNILISSDLKQVQPVILALRRKRNYSFTFLREKFPFRLTSFLLKQNISISLLPPFFKNHSQRPSFLNQLEACLNKHNPFHFKGIDYWPSIKKDFLHLLEKEIPRLRERINNIKHLFHQKRWDCLIVDEDVSPNNKALVLIAKAFRIPSLVIQHGIPFRSVPVAYSPVSATAIAVWGKRSEELLRSWNVPAQKIQMVGAPRYDLISEMKENPQNATKLKRGLGLTAKHVLFLALDPFREDHRPDFSGLFLTQLQTKLLVETVLAACGQLTDADLVIKLHPRERNEALIREWVLSFPGADKVKIIKNCNTLLLVQACDLLMTEFSTVALEALLLDKPVVTINLHGYKDAQPYFEDGLTKRAHNAESLLKFISEGLQGKNSIASNALQQYFYQIDGRASERTAELIERIMTQHA